MKTKSPFGAWEVAGLFPRLLYRRADTSLWLMNVHRMAMCLGSDGTTKPGTMLCLNWDNVDGFLPAPCGWAVTLTNTAPPLAPLAPVVDNQSTKEVTK